MQRYMISCLDLNVWDLAAGCLIIQEAGGRVTDVYGKDYELRTRNLVASNGLIHNELRQQLVAARMWMEECGVNNSP